MVGLGMVHGLSIGPGVHLGHLLLHLVLLMWGSGWDGDGLGVVQGLGIGHEGSIALLLFHLSLLAQIWEQCKVKEIGGGMSSGFGMDCRILSVFSAYPASLSLFYSGDRVRRMG